MLNTGEKNIYVGCGIGRLDERFLIKHQGFVNKEFFKSLVFTPADLLKVEKILFELSRIDRSYLPHYCLIKKINESKNLSCSGLWKKIVIGPYGDVYPCTGMLDKLCLGNLKESNFNLFLKSNEKRIKLK